MEGQRDREGRRVDSIFAANQQNGRATLGKIPPRHPALSLAPVAVAAAGAFSLAVARRAAAKAGSGAAETADLPPGQPTEGEAAGDRSRIVHTVSHAEHCA